MPPEWDSSSVSVHTRLHSQLRSLGFRRRRLNSLDTGFLELLPLTTADAKPIAAILKKYRDIRIQLADAALVHLAARDGLDTIFTLDQRDFSVYRLPKGRAFRLIP